MLNERTADSAVDAPPDVSAPAGAIAVLREVADFLEQFPGIPEPCVTVSGIGQVEVQLSLSTAHPGERCQAVARIAQADDAFALVQSCGGSGLVYETFVTVGNHRVHVYAPLAEPRSEREGVR